MDGQGRPAVWADPFFFFFSYKRILADFPDPAQIGHKAGVILVPITFIQVLKPFARHFFAAGAGRASVCGMFLAVAHLAFKAIIPLFGVLAQTAVAAVFIPQIKRAYPAVDAAGRDHFQCHGGAPFKKAVRTKSNA